MKTLARNRRPFVFCLYDGKEPIFDEWGNETGEYRVAYKPPVCVMANISHATGISNIEQFGDLERYDKVIVLEDIETPISETTVLFVDKPYEADDDGLPLYDYIVRRVARSINSVSIAITKVDVSGVQSE